MTTKSMWFSSSRSQNKFIVLMAAKVVIFEIEFKFLPFINHYEMAPMVLEPKVHILYFHYSTDLSFKVNCKLLIVYSKCLR
jgi:hypothetical protein